jgi:hypothetical protein
LLRIASAAFFETKTGNRVAAIFDQRADLGARVSSADAAVRPLSQIEWTIA